MKSLFSVIFAIGIILLGTATSTTNASAANEQAGLMCGVIDTPCNCMFTDAEPGEVRPVSRYVCASGYHVFLACGYRCNDYGGIAWGTRCYCP